MRNPKCEIRNTDGFIAIVSLLIVASIAMFFAMTMLLDGVRNASLSTSSVNYENARINMTTCLEDVLLRIKMEEEYNQNLNYTLSEGNSCTTSIVWFVENQVSPGITERLVELDVTGVSNNFPRTFSYDLKVAKFDINNSDGSLDYMNTIDFINIEETS